MDKENKNQTEQLQSMRKAFGEGLVISAGFDSRIVALSADLSSSVGLSEFKNKFPDRYIEVGVAEQNLVTVASGIASMGKIPFIASFAIFSPGRNWEQIRTTVCYNNSSVKIVGTHAGLNVGADGGSHQALEDIALMRVLPRMTVISPCDAMETKKAVIAMSKISGPAYLRLIREESPVIYGEDRSFEIGKADIVFQSTNIHNNPLRSVFTKKENKKTVGIIATGIMVSKAINTAKKLQSEGYIVSVLNVSTIKPLDEYAIVKLAHNMGALVTCEEHQIYGGLGSAVSECLSAHFPIPIEFIGVKDSFGQSGRVEELFKHYGLQEEDIYKAVKRVVIRKK